jgi:predicted dehydrogenase
MARTIGIGVIGMGWMGAVHSRSYQQVPVRFPDSALMPRLVVCADDVEARATEAQKMLGFARYTTNWREVLEDPEVEVVNIAAPNNQHLEMVRAAAAAGKHILCEKPVGRSPGETAEIEAAAREAGVLTWVGFNYRWAPLVQYARQLVQAGKLGRLTHYRGRFFAGYASNPDGVLSWRFCREEAGLGALGDLMSHVVDMAHWLSGPVDRVIGQRETFIPERPLPTPGVGTHFSVGAGGPKAPVTNEDYVGALVQFENGAYGTFEVCRVIQGPKCQLAFEVHGTLGALRWDFERMNEMQLYLATDDDTRDGYTTVYTGPVHPDHSRFYPGPALSLGYEDLKIIEAHRFLQSIAAGQQGAPGFGDALAASRVLSAIERSWRSERWEKVEG